MSDRPSVRLTRRGADRLASGHVWVYSSDVADRGAAQPGDVVTVLDHRGRPAGVAHFSSTSQICIRLLSRRAEPVDAAFFRRRLEAAAAHRRAVVRDSEAYRLVHAEGDQLPALIVDRYGDSIVAQMLDQGMDRATGAIVASLVEMFSPRSVILRNDAAVRARESLPLETTVAHGEAPAGPVSFSVNGLKLRADLLHGQKTGVFLDQRENYRAAAQYAHGNALDCFTSTGGFALHLAGTCARVEAIDSSAAALATARENAAANEITNVDFRAGNAFDLLAAYSSQRRRFDTVVLDPPAFAKSRDSMEGALRGYKEINLRALQLLEPGGILVTCSCSYHLSEAQLLELLAGAALDAHRTLRVLERRTQAADHPILLTVPETHYLKCLIVQVL